MKTRFSARMATAADATLETFDHTKLSAINTCPTYGILRYQMHRKMSADARSMALEAGSAMHECFSFVRLVSLIEQHKGKPDFQDVLWDVHGERLFGQDRLDLIGEQVRNGTDVVEIAKRGCIAVLDSGSFYDDPRDKRRTLSNLEECIYAYINRWRWDHRIWMRDANDPANDVGIEIPFDTVIELIPDQGEPITFRLTGRIDGIHYNSSGDLCVHDNKTASRLGEAWAMSFAVNHQVTGYCVACNVFTQQPVHKIEIHGLSIPMPKSYEYGGIIRETVSRYDYHYAQWADWLVHTIRLAREYEGDPINAPKFTHSCNRYFRACSFVPFCDAPPDEQLKIIEEMHVEEWSPLSKPILDGVGSE